MPTAPLRVEDNGRGIPVDIHEKEGIPAVELVLTKLHAGGQVRQRHLQGFPVGSTV